MAKLGCSTRMLLLGIIVLLLFVGGCLSGPIGSTFVGGHPLLGFLSVPKPKPELPAEEVAHILGFSLTNSILATWVTMLILVASAYLATRRMKLVPTGFQNLVEAIIGAILTFVEEAAGVEKGRRFFPVVATIFLFVMLNAWLSLLPIFGTIGIESGHGVLVPLLRSANTDVNTPLALALISAIFVEYWGMSSVGVLRYLSKFVTVGPLFRSIGNLARGKIGAGLGGILTGLGYIFLGMLETLSELVRIVSFTFRLFGNMTAGEILLLVVVFLVPLIATIPFYFLEILVGFVQALIFAGLTLVFGIIAVAPHEEHG